MFAVSEERQADMYTENQFKNKPSCGLFYVLE